MSPLWDSTRGTEVTHVEATEGANQRAYGCSEKMAEGAPSPQGQKSCAPGSASSEISAEATGQDTSDRAAHSDHS